MDTSLLVVVGHPLALCAGPECGYKNFFEDFPRVNDFVFLILGFPGFGSSLFGHDLFMPIDAFGDPFSLAGPSLLMNAGNRQSQTRYVAILHWLILAA